MVDLQNLPQLESETQMHLQSAGSPDFKVPAVAEVSSSFLHLPSRLVLQPPDLCHHGHQGYPDPVFLQSC